MARTRKSKGWVTSQGYRRFQLTVPGVGRITNSSGTKDRVEFERRKALLHKLAKREANLDLLRAFKAGEVSIEELIEADRHERLSQTSSELVARRPLWDAVERWLATYPKRASAIRYRKSFDRLRQLGPLGDGALVADLATVSWVRLESQWGNSAADWNHLRRAVSRFLSVSLGDKFHPLRRQVMAKFPTRRERARRAGLTVDEFKDALVHVRDEYQPIYVTLVSLGLRLGEYAALRPGHLNEANGILHVPGTKTEASDAELPLDARLTPWIRAAIPCPISETQVRYHWKKACRKAGVTGSTRVHDLRHTTGQWLAELGFQLSEIMAYLRHDTPQVTLDYLAHAAKRTLGEKVADRLDFINERPGGHLRRA